MLPSSEGIAIMLDELLLDVLLSRRIWVLLPPASSRDAAVRRIHHVTVLPDNQD